MRSIWLPLGVSAILLIAFSILLLSSFSDPAAEPRVTNCKVRSLEDCLLSALESQTGQVSIVQIAAPQGESYAHLATLGSHLHYLLLAESFAIPEVWTGEALGVNFTHRGVMTGDLIMLRYEIQGNASQAAAAMRQILASLNPDKEIYLHISTTRNKWDAHLKYD